VGSIERGMEKSKGEEVERAGRWRTEGKARRAVMGGPCALQTPPKGMGGVYTLGVAVVAQGGG